MFVIFLLHTHTLTNTPSSLPLSPSVDILLLLFLKASKNDFVSNINPDNQQAKKKQQRRKKRIRKPVDTKFSMLPLPSAFFSCSNRLFYGQMNSNRTIQIHMNIFIYLSIYIYPRKKCNMTDLEYSIKIIKRISWWSSE